MHVRGDARARYEFDKSLFSKRGAIRLADLTTARAVADAINALRDVGRFPEVGVNAGELYATGLIEEASQLLINAYMDQVAPDSFSLALEYIRDKVGGEATEEVLRRFVGYFPPPMVAFEAAAPDEYLEEIEGGVENRSATLEELVMLRLSNENPAQERFHDLFDDSALTAETAYEETVAGLDAFFRRLPGFGASPSLLTLLRQPASESPTSVRGQLTFIIDNWGELIGEDFAQLTEKLLRAIDVIEEESKWGDAGPGPPAVLDAAALIGAGPVEYERFSADTEWMPRLVMIAKSTYVWLHQLGRRYGREVQRLDQVPVEELDELAAAGFTGLWLIGLWERSTASKKIKQLRGDSDAVASAYAIDDYVIASELGGDTAFEWLRDRAWERGIRVASDMVPNHVGIDSRWVIEHPEWFVGLDEPPFPAYRFEGPDLSADDRVTIQIEDHYWDGSDAAVVFKRHDHTTGVTRFLYHGNDGTALPWNDTAQLDYLRDDVREHVIQTILAVARRVPIIRFDAAMTLARQHIQRLWYPPAGSGGAIPSRSRYGLADAEFQRLMPAEFWREVVDRVATEVPDTLLLAEAFWMMEGYFVRTLGMHRVYNSAFMHMLASEDNASFRSLIKNVMEFDPEILKRFVNFMNNPDEETAAGQFGTGDKYFGVATVLATLPGLPMFGHGQVEGLTEKYGMEYRRPRTDEQPNQGVIDRHRRETFPLLHRREQFAHVDHFLLFDLVDSEGVVSEDVLAYSNLRDGKGSLLVYHNTFGDFAGTLHTASPAMRRLTDGRELVTETLADGLGLRRGTDDVVTFRDHMTDLEYVSRSADLHREGLFVHLGAYQCQLFVDFNEIEEAPEPYRLLATRLAGKGVPSLADAIEIIHLGPLHAALLAVAEERSREAASDLLAAVYARGFQAAAAAADLSAAAAARDRGADALLMRTRRRFSDALEERDALTTVLATARVVTALRAPEAEMASWKVVAALRNHLPGGGSDAIADLFPVAVRVAEWFVTFDIREPSRGAAALIDDLTTSASIRSYLGVHRFDDADWFNREAFERLIGLLLVAALDRSPSKAAVKRAAAVLELLAEAGERSEYRLDRLSVSTT